VVGAVISEKAQMVGGVLSEKGSQLKNKIQQKEFGKKIMGMFGKKKETNLDDAQPVEEEK
jgi:hypothetical protein